MVKAQITGAIIGNSLLGLGLAIVAGSMGKSQGHQKFSRDNAGQLGSMLTLAMIALLIPALFDMTERPRVSAAETAMLDEHLSLAVSVVLIALYVANLIYTLVTHRDVFASAQDDAHQGEAHWSVKKSMLVLVGATAVTALQAELVSSSLEATASGLGLTPFFLGITVLAVVGNAAEYISAVYFARQNRMGLVMSITVGSTIQIALLVAPLLVLLSWLIGKPMDLVLNNPLELVTLVGSVLIANSVAQDGETNWLEGFMLLGVYVILAIAFFFLPSGAAHIGG